MKWGEDVRERMPGTSLIGRWLEPESTQSVGDRDSDARVEVSATSQTSPLF